MPRLIEETWGIAVCMENGFLPIAGCRNFDPVVVDRGTRVVSYVSHDLLWSHGWTDLRACLQASPFVYEEFWGHAISDASFPHDFYEARKRWLKPPASNAL